MAWGNQGNTARMGKLTKAEQERLPSTLVRSPAKAQDTFIRTLESAEKTYDGDKEASHRVALASLKHSFEKVGDHWEPKDHKGPSDEHDAKRGAAARAGGPTKGGVDANATKAHLLTLAQRLDIKGRSSMTKAELVDALDGANRKASAKSLRS